MSIFFKRKLLLPIINPENKLKILWDILISIFIYIMGVVISFNFIFGLPQNQILYWLTTVLFFIDIILNFLTPIRVGHKMLSSRKEIAKKYLTTWFSIDLLIAIPFTFFLFKYIAPYVENPDILSTLDGMFIFLRISKLFFNSRTFNKIGEILSLNPSIMRLIVFFIWFSLMIHFIALGWVFIEAADKSGSNILQYTRALYWAVTTVATIGYGDITPDKNNLYQLIFTIVVQLLGVGFYSYIIGNVANLISNIDIQKTKMIRKKEEVNIFMKTKNIPFYLQNKIKEYYNYLWYTRKNISDYSILEELPFTLKHDISYFLNNEIIQLVPIFKNANEIFIREIIQYLKLLIFLPGDLIIRQGEFGNAMYFLARGEVDAIVNNNVVANLKTGSFFGEMSLIKGEKRNASIKALDFCDVYQLNKNDFDYIRSKYPEFDMQVSEIVVERERNSEAQCGKS